MTGNIRLSVELSLTPREAFEILLDELSLALLDRGMKFAKTSTGGKILEGDTEVGTVQECVPGERVSFLWSPKSWEKETSNISITFTASNGGTAATIEHQNWDKVLRDEKGELLGWFAGEVVAPLLYASAPNRLGDWITDRHARRPWGAQSRATYRNPIYHRPNFLAILDSLKLEPSDFLLEVGCGGGAFLHEALKSGCRASAIDHSPDMVRLASDLNSESIRAKKLEITISEADTLPYPENTFTCAVMTGVLGFLPNPTQTIKEIFRVLRNGGRFVAFTSSKELRGTPAAPEPMASRLHFYEDREIEDMTILAGFDTARVEHPSLFEHAKKAGVPDSDLNLFRGTRGSQLLLAHKG